MLLSALILLAAGTAAATPTVVEPNPSDMTTAEIRAHNKQLDRKHPFFIRCVREADTGSLLARKPVCRTNARWELLDKASRRATDELASDMTTRSAQSGAN